MESDGRKRWKNYKASDGMMGSKGTIVNMNCGKSALGKVHDITLSLRSDSWQTKAESTRRRRKRKKERKEKKNWAITGGAVVSTQHRSDRT